MIGVIKTFSWQKSLLILLLTALSVILIAVVLITLLTSSNGHKTDICRLDEGFNGKCVSGGLCSVATISENFQCEADMSKTCCSLDAIFPTPANVIENSLNDEELLIERVDEKNFNSNNNMQWKFKNFIRCGTAGQNQSYDSSIVQPAELPFHVVLKYKDTPENDGKDYKFMCDASLISGSVKHLFSC